MMVTTPFCRNQKDKTKQQKIVGTSETFGETTEDNTEISKTCHRQGSTSDQNRKITHKEDQKKEYKVKINSATTVVKGLTHKPR